MLELTEFPYLPAGNPAKSVLALVYLCRELPPQGEQFRLFRTRVKQFKLWDQDRIQGTLDFMGMQRTGTIKPSQLALSIKAQKTDDKAKELLAKRLWEVNPLLFKSILELLKERVYSRDEVIKHIDSFAYRGKKPTRPQLEGWLNMALGLDILKMVGIALDLGPQAEAWLAEAKNLDVEEFLEEAADAASAAPAPAPAAANEPGDDEPPAEDAAPVEDAAPEDEAPAAVTAPAVPARAPVAPAPAPRAPAAPQAGTHAVLIDVNGMASPRGRSAPITTARFAAHDVFPEDVLGETAERIQAWWGENTRARAGAAAEDFGLDMGAWMDGAEEALYRAAVASALVFRLGRDRAAVTALYRQLDDAGVLRDLYYGTAPETLAAGLDPQALMLASLVARRCAEAPELAATLEKQPSAAAALEALEQALGRGFLKIELYWLMGALEDMGALRFDDLAGVTALPRRLVRDTLFRLGYVATPYAHDAASLAPAARAARRVAGAARPADEVIMAFALAAGCAYDCPNRRSCEHACRERTE